MISHCNALSHSWPLHHEERQLCQNQVLVRLIDLLNYIQDERDKAICWSFRSYISNVLDDLLREYAATLYNITMTVTTLIIQVSS